MPGFGARTLWAAPRSRVIAPLPGSSVPERLVHRLTWQNHCDVSDLSPGVIVLLYAGKDDALSLDAVLHSVDPKLTRRVRAFDVRKGWRASCS